MPSFSPRQDSWKSLPVATTASFSVWFFALVSFVVVIQQLMLETQSPSTYPYFAFVALALVSSFISLVTIVAILVEYRFFVRISVVLLGFTGCIAILCLGLHLSTRRVSEFLLGGILIIGAHFCALLVLRFLGFRMVSSTRQKAPEAYQYPLFDLFILTTAVAIAAASVRMSGAEWYSTSLRYYLYLGGLSACFVITSLLALVVVLGRCGWYWQICTVLLAPIGYLPATMVAGMTQFAPWWCGALTACHTCFVAILLLVFRVFGFRVTRSGDTLQSVLPATDGDTLCSQESP